MEINMAYKVFDNVVTKSMADSIENSMLDPDFPWFCMKKTVYPKDPTHKYDDGILYKDRSSFAHIFTTTAEKDKPAQANSQYCDIPMSLLNSIIPTLKLTKIEILRIRANFVYPLDSNQKYLPFCPHTDGDYDHSVLLYYVNDSDGDTIFFDDNDVQVATVSPKKGRFVIFEGNKLHAAYPPRYHDKRVVINYNLTMDFDYGLK